ncbi:MAG: hypothetical protein J0H78_21225 [Rhizobiales bacterium]|nr:hypothetical protein [Hyphomicrobiales bacterium]OJY45342.1 MAG: hypothetical protein BGP08_02155 [Rhizobiales bacterium 64-17]
MQHDHSGCWTFGDTSLTRIVESEEPLLSPFEIYPDCTQAHLDANRNLLTPHFFDAQRQLLTITIQSFLIAVDVSGALRHGSRSSCVSIGSLAL